MISKSSFGVSYKQVNLWAFTTLLLFPWQAQDPTRRRLSRRNPLSALWPQTELLAPAKLTAEMESWAVLHTVGELCFPLREFMPFTAVLLDSFPTCFPSSYVYVVQKEGIASKLTSFSLSFCKVPQVTLTFKHLFVMLEHLDYVMALFWVKFFKCSYFILSTSTYISIYFDMDFSLMEKVKCLWAV